MLYTTTIISGFVALCEWSETRQWNSSAYTGNTEQVCSKFFFEILMKIKFNIEFKVFIMWLYVDKMIHYCIASFNFIFLIFFSIGDLQMVCDFASIGTCILEVNHLTVFLNMDTQT